MERVSTVMRPRRREYSAEFKASVLEQCRQAGASIAGVALAQGINQNMVHRWIREERGRLELAELQKSAAAFLPVQLQPAAVAVASAPQPLPSDQCGSGICIEIERAGGKVTVTWPLQSAAECRVWLREWLR